MENVPFGAGGMTVRWVEPQAFDDSGVTPTLVSRSHTPGQFFPSGMLTTVTYTWRDGADNEGSCSFTVFITEGNDLFINKHTKIVKKPNQNRTNKKQINKQTEKKHCTLMKTKAVILLERYIVRNIFDINVLNMLLGLSVYRYSSRGVGVLNYLSLLIQNKDT